MGAIQALSSNQLKALSDYTFITKYARYDHKKKRRETWDEAINRVRDMHLFRYATRGIDEDINWAFDMVRSKRCLPSMRSMQFGGDAILANDARMYNCAYTLADRVRFFSESLWMLLSGCGVGFSVQKQHIARLPELVGYKSPDEKEIFTYTVGDTIEGWADALDILVQTYFKGSPISGKEVFFDFSRIRRKGSWLKTSGGRAPGAKSLRIALKQIKKVLREAVENEQLKLRPIQVYDIIMMAADAVLSGGIRRSATLALFSPDDQEMMTAKIFNTQGKVLSNKRKDGTWLTEYGVAINLENGPKQGDEVTIRWDHIMPWRARSNNSAALLRDECTKEQFFDIISNAKKYGEPAFIFLDNLDYGYNPCFSGKMKILTSNGYKTLKDLWVDGGEQEYNKYKSFDDYGSIEVVNSNGVVKATNVYRTSKLEPVYDLTLKNGVKIRATAHHKFFVLKRRRKTVDGKRQYYWDKSIKRLAELKSGDILPINPESAFGQHHDPDLALLSGWVIGDGTIRCRQNGCQQANIIVYDNDITSGVDVPLREALIRCYSRHNKSTNQNPKYAGYIQNHEAFGFDKMTMSSIVLGRLLRENGIVPGEKHQIPQFIWSSNKETMSIFLKGIFSADGSAQVSYKKKSISIRLWQANKQFLLDIQLLLNQFGICSTVLKRQDARQVLMNDGRGGMKLYDSKEQFELIIGKRENVLTFFNDIGFLHESKNQIVEEWLEIHHGSLNSHNTYRVKVKSIRYVGEEEVFCLTEPNNNEICIEGVLTSQCCEIGLNPICNETGETGWAVCNLTEINGGAIKSRGDFREAVKAATIIGTLQAGYTYFHYLNDASRRIIRRERLLGVSVTGWMENPELLFNPELQKEMAELAVSVNKEYAEKIGINQAARVTCTKPAGNSSCVLGTSSGIGPHHAVRYLRRFITNSVDQTLQYFKLWNPQAVEKSVWGKDDEVITFCIEAPDAAITKEDLTAVQFLEKVKSTYLNWVLTGTADPDSSPKLTHNVSNTVPVDEHEWDEVAEFIYENRYHLSGVSLIAKRGDKIYRQAPMEKIESEEDFEKWNELVSKFKYIEWSEFTEAEDYTTLAQEPACANGACDI